MAKEETIQMQGEVVETSSINVGGRLVALDEDGRVNRIEPAARIVADALGVELRLNEPLAPGDAEKLADALADCLVQAMRREPSSQKPWRIEMRESGSPGIRATRPTFGQASAFSRSAVSSSSCWRDHIPA